MFLLCYNGVMNFLHTFEPERVLLALGSITIYWYGLFVTSGVVLGIVVTVWLAKKYGFNKDAFWSFVFWLLIFGFIGDRLFHVFYEFSYYWQNPLDIFKVWQGGLAIHGAIIGGFLTILFYSRKKILAGASTWWPRFWLMADISVIGIILGQAIGRWGNYFNQELYGLPTDSIIGIPIALANRVQGFSMHEYFLPTFLFQSLANLLIFVILFSWHRYRIKRSKMEDGSSDKKSNYELRITNYGYIFISYLLLYGVARFTIEFMRIDVQPVFWSLRLGQWASVGLVLAGVVFVIIRQKVGGRRSE